MKNYLKNILAMVIVIIPGILQAQSFNFHIKGQVGHLSAPAKVYIRYFDYLSRKSQLDSAVINNGGFTITGTSDQPKLATIYLDKRGTGFDWRTQGHVYLYVEAGDISVTSPDSIQNAKISGGPVNADNYKLTLALKDETAKLNKLDTAYQAAPPEKKDSRKFLDSLTNRAGLIRLKERPIYLAFIKANPSSIMSLTAVLDISDDDKDVKDIETAFNLLSPEVRASKRGTEYALEIDQMKKTAVGAVAPDFTLPDSLEKAVSLHDFKGKYVFVDFWASWCGPCRRENPNVLKAYTTYHDKNFTVLGVSLDKASSKKAWLKAVHDDRLPWTQLCGLNGFDSDAARLYGVHTIPQNFLIGPDETIVAFNLRGDDLINKLQQVLSQ